MNTPIHPQPIYSLILIMGPAACGKTTLAKKLNDALRWPVLDADLLHPPENVEKMAAGTPLTDHDRAPWLKRIAKRIQQAIHLNTKLLIVCSALKQDYRKTLHTDHEQMLLVYLHAPPTLLKKRLEQRTGHFMKANMLQSQLDTLQPPSTDHALWIDAQMHPDQQVKRILQHLYPSDFH